MGKVMIQIGIADEKFKTHYTKSKASVVDLSQALMALEIIKEHLIRDFKKMGSEEKSDKSILDNGSDN